MGTSKVSDQIALLGKEIVARLGARSEPSPDNPDLLSRWIANEIAASLTAVDRARSATARNRAVDHATDLILRLWRHRSDWPQGWPPEPARGMLAQLTKRRRHEASSDPTGSPWVDRFEEMTDLWAEEARLWWKLGLLELGVEDQRKIIALGLAAEDEFDLDRIRQDVELHDEAKAWLRANDALAATKAKAVIEKRLKQIATRRRKLNGEVLRSARPSARSRKRGGKSPRSEKGRDSAKGKP
jgi:hypothetical protein